MAASGGRVKLDFDADHRFTSTWWPQTTPLGPPDYQWRSYTADGEEVARMLLSLRFPSHSPRKLASAVLIWNFAVRSGLCRSSAHLGTTIVLRLVREFRNGEMYIGPTPESLTFWTRFGWPRCECERCGARDFIVRRP